MTPDACGSSLGRANSETGMSGNIYRTDTGDVTRWTLEVRTNGNSTF